MKVIEIIQRVLQIQNEKSEFSPNISLIHDGINELPNSEVVTLRDGMEKQSRYTSIFLGDSEPPFARAVRGQYLEIGIDNVLAWYTPFHFDPDNWGITIKASGIELVAYELYNNMMPTELVYQSAFEFLLEHELGHFKGELLVSGVEASSNTAIYKHGKLRQHNGKPSWGIAEEGLCNSFGRESLPKDYKSILDSFMQSSPVGYRDFKRHPKLHRAKSWGEVLDEICFPNKSTWVSVPTMNLLNEQVPVRLMLDGSGIGGSVAGALLGPIYVVETPEFLADIEASGNKNSLMKSWKNTVQKLANGALANVHLEKIVSNIYSVRLSKGWRAALQRPLEGNWEALMVDQQHNRLYDRIHRRFG